MLQILCVVARFCMDLELVRALWAFMLLLDDLLHLLLRQFCAVLHGFFGSIRSAHFLSAISLLFRSAWKDTTWPFASPPGRSCVSISTCI